MLLIASILMLQYFDLSLSLSSTYIPVWPVCDIEYYFDTSSLACKQCDIDNHFVVDESSVDYLGNALGCRCQDGYFVTTLDCSKDTSGQCINFACSSCNSSGLSVFEGVSCSKCGNSTLGLNHDVNSPFYVDCECDMSSSGSYQSLIETDIVGNKLGSKICRTCPSGSAVVDQDQTVAGQRYSADLNTCQSCPDKHMSFSVDSDYALSCNCESGYSKVGQAQIGVQSCIDSAASASYLLQEAEASIVSYSSLGIDVTSLTVLHYFTRAATGCMYYGGSGNNQDCQALANLCVLHLYDADKGPCSVFRTILTSRGTNIVSEVTQWGAGMPWLFYDTNILVCKNTGLQSVMDFNNKFLSFTAAAYTLNGSFVGYRDVDTMFSYCRRRSPYSGSGGGSATSTKWMIFGSSESHSYDCDLALLLNESQLFYDLYLYDDVALNLQPVPVRVTNLVVKASYPNKDFLANGDICSAGDVAVRRFFLYDVVSGFSDTSFNVDSSAQVLPQVVRFASKVTFDFRIQESDPQRMYVPVVTITYSEVSTGSWDGDTGQPQLVSYTINARYTMDIANFQSSFNSVMIAAMVVAILIFVVRFYAWRMRNLRPHVQSSGNSMAMSANSFGSVDLEMVLEIATIAAHSWVLVSFPVLVITAEYWFVFFKLQDTVSVLLPPQDRVYDSSSSYYYFTSLLHLMFFFQSFYILRLVYKQCNADIFFIDWEPSRGGGHKGAKEAAKGDGGGVSVWRTILVANEWAEMQTMRRTNVKFTLFFIGFLLLGLDLEYNATAQPNLDDLSPGQLNVVLRFANVTWWWFLLSFVQVAWKFLFYERYVCEPYEQSFVDACTIAKISIVVLTEPYNGYYLHCRSPHQFADGSMPELVAMLQKEEAGLTVDRSLQGAPPDAQSFELFLSGEWRVRYNKIASNLVQPLPSWWDMLFGGSNAPAAARAGRRANGSGESAPRSDKMLRAHSDMNTFLQNFIDNNHTQPELKRSVLETTYLDRLCSFAPDLTLPGQPSVMHASSGFDYVKVTFLGNELDLLVFNVLTYCIFDLWLGMTALSILLTYLVDFAVGMLRENYGQAVLTKKTLVDERFLI